MVVSEERAVANGRARGQERQMGPNGLMLSPRRAQEWRALSARERGLLTPEAVSRWTRDLHEDDWSLADVALLEQRRQDNLRMLRLGADLTEPEVRLLHYLAQAHGQVRTYVQIANHLWGTRERPIRGHDLKSQDGYASPYVRHIWGLIGEIRRKIEIDPARPQYLALRRGIGYSLHSSPPSRDDGIDYDRMAREHEALRAEVRYELGGDIGSMPIPRGPQLGPAHPDYLEADVTEARSEPHTTPDT